MDGIVPWFLFFLTGLMDFSAIVAGLGLDRI